MPLSFKTDILKSNWTTGKLGEVLTWKTENFTLGVKRAKVFSLLISHFRHQHPLTPSLTGVSRGLSFFPQAWQKIRPGGVRKHHPRGKKKGRCFLTLGVRTSPNLPVLEYSTFETKAGVESTKAGTAPPVFLGLSWSTRCWVLNRTQL